jgi:hypothetical protein
VDAASGAAARISTAVISTSARKRVKSAREHAELLIKT